MKNFFKRDHSEQYLEDYVPYISKQFNYLNIESMNKRKIIACFHAGHEKDFLAYRFDVLSDWMKYNERYNMAFAERLERVINTLGLKEELNSFEQQKIIEIQGIIFAKWRNLKQLISDFTLFEHEFVFYRYEIDSLSDILNDNNKHSINEANLYITTKRFVFSKDLDILSIAYDEIQNYHIMKSGITLNLKNGRKYLIECDNVYAIYVSLERVLRRENIIFN